MKSHSHFLQNFVGNSVKLRRFIGVMGIGVAMVLSFKAQATTGNNTTSVGLQRRSGVYALLEAIIRLTVTSQISISTWPFPFSTRIPLTNMEFGLC